MYILHLALKTGLLIELRYDIPLDTKYVISRGRCFQPVCRPMTSAEKTEPDTKGQTQNYTKTRLSLKVKNTHAVN